MFSMALSGACAMAIIGISVVSFRENHDMAAIIELSMAGVNIGLLLSLVGRQ
jgi:hypothetical protein